MSWRRLQAGGRRREIRKAGAAACGQSSGDHPTGRTTMPARTPTRSTRVSRPLRGTRRARHRAHSQVWLVRITRRGAGDCRRCRAGGRCIGSDGRGGSGGIRRHRDPPLQYSAGGAANSAPKSGGSTTTRAASARPATSQSVEVYLHAAKSHTSPAAYLPSCAKDVTRMRPLKARPDSSFWDATAPSTLANSRKTHPRPRVRPASGS